MNQTQGIVYQLTNERERGMVASYHRKPSPNFLNKTKHKVDIACLKSIEQRDAIIFDGEDFVTKFTVGMEVEKNSLHRNAVREYELFCGFEEDRSCGYEAVTHVLPLLPAGKWRTKVFDMIHKAERIIDDNYSPSDKRCGGHITIGVDGMRGDEIRELMRKNCGIILALFRKRLNTVYCGSNRRMQSMYDSRFNSWSGASSVYYSYDAHSKYQTALVKGATLEFRVPSKFESVKQTMRRYELFYEIVNFSINTPNGKHDSLLKKLRPIILSMYNGDVAKTDNIMELSKHFRAFILKGTIHPDIEEFLQ